MQAALTITEQFGEYSGLYSRERLRFRLLAEELIGLMRGISGDVEAVYWAERKGSTFLLHLSSDVNMTQELRQQLLGVSTSGRNAAAKGFMGRLLDMIAAALLPPEDGELSPYALGYIGPGCMSEYFGRSMSGMWSMVEYRTALRENTAHDAAAKREWDELESSIVANLADEVTVGITGNHVEITILKDF